MHTPSLYLSLPGAARVEAGGATYRAKPPAFATDARGGVTAPLVYFAANAADDIDEFFDLRLDGTGQVSRAKGAIIISEGFASPILVRQFQELGAVGVIAVNPGVDVHWGTCSTIWGVPDLDDLPRKPAIPAVAVNKPDGEKLIALAREGGEGTIYAELEEGWYDSKMVEAVIPGAVEPDKFVLLHGHLDSWDVGVGDNATGDACMLGVAEALWANRDNLRRSVRICWWAGHSTGRYAGSTWYADAFAIDLDENCVAQVNCDSPGCRWATEFINLSRMSETDEVIMSAIEDVAGKTAEGERPHRAGDYSFNNIGISGYLMLSSTMTTAMREEKGYYTVGGCGANIVWHTENDTLEIANKEYLERDIKVYLLSVLRAANAPILPFDWRATVQEFQDTIAKYQSAAGDRFDLTPSAEAATDLLGTLSAFYEEVEAGSVPEDKANTVIQDLARILVPINYCREARFRHDPAMTVPPLPTIFTATELDDHTETLGFAQNQLLRGQNRLVAALRQAKRHIGLVTG